MFVPIHVSFELRAWFKGADTVVVLKYLLWKFRHILDSSGSALEPSVQQYLQEIANCIHHTDEFMTGLYHSGLFIPRLRLERIVRHGREMLASFARYAGLAFQRELPRFKFNPKYHMLCHLVLDLHRAMIKRCSPLNPTSFSCQMPEDFINKCSTLSRGVSGKAIALRTLDLYRVSVASAW